MHLLPVQDPAEWLHHLKKNHFTNICHCQGSKIQVVDTVQNAKKNVKHFNIHGNLECVWQILLEVVITNMLKILPELPQKSGKIFPKWQMTEGKKKKKF